MRSLSLAGTRAKQTCSGIKIFWGLLLGLQKFSKDIFGGMKPKQVFDSDISFHNFTTV